MLVETRIPRAASVARFVESIVYHVSDPMDPALERILPGGNIRLMVNLIEDQFRTYSGPNHATVTCTRGAVLAGPNARPTVIDTMEQRSLITVNFKTAGVSPFFRAPLSESCGQLVDLDQFWGTCGTTIRERLLDQQSAEQKMDAMERVLESLLLKRSDCPQDPDRAISWAASALERGLPVSEVSTRLGLLPKTFVRRFRHQMGLTPKKFARVRRLQRLLRSIHDPVKQDWSQLAAQHGYADQAHLIHDFRDLTDLTPSTYKPRAPGEQNHVAIRK